MSARRAPTSGRSTAAADAARSFPVDLVHHGDCVAGMAQLPDDCCDLVIADPPYNASKGGRWRWDDATPLPGFGGAWSKVMAAWDDMPLEQYLRFTLAWLTQVKRIVRPTGSLWVHGTYHNIGAINCAMQLLGIEIINEVIWYKRNSFPNLSGRRLTASHETILWAHTGGRKRRYRFDYDAAKQMCGEDDAFKQPGKQMRTVWDIPNNKDCEELRYGRHPTGKPLRLLARMLRISGRAGGVVVVPFAGAGSECVAAVRHGMHFVAFETEPQYVEIARRRLVGERDASGETGVPDEPRAAPRVNIDHLPRPSASIPSLIKWTGSKRSQAVRIAARIPAYQRYFEPFVGGRAVLYLAGHPGAVAGDLYAPLIALWRLLQSSPGKVIANYRRHWQRLQRRLPEYYYDVRDRFNADPDPLDLNFLMRTCVNGIVRFNEQGAFNNSFHLSRRGMEPDRFAAIVDRWTPAIQGVRFVCQDYEATLADAGAGDFAYLDPPYAGNKQRYVSGLDLARFWRILESLNRRGARWALSFDGQRGERDFSHDVPQALYRRRILLTSGNSAVHKVLNGPIEPVQESLYLNY